MPETFLTLIRTLAAFVWLFIIARMIGFRQISQLSFFEYVAGITIGSMASSMAVEIENRPVAVFTGLLVFALLAVVTSFVRHKSYRARKWFDGEPTKLVADGELDLKSLGQARMTIDELVMLLRREGVFDLSEVSDVFFEPTGQVSVRKKGQYAPLTPRQAGMTAVTAPLPHVVVVDGRVLRRTLQEAGKDREWLHRKLAEQGLDGTADVAMAQVKGDSLFIWTGDSQGVPAPAPPVSDVTRFSLQKVQAELEMFALDTGDEGAKKTYTDAARRLTGVINRVEPYLL